MRFANGTSAVDIDRMDSLLVDNTLSKDVSQTSVFELYFWPIFIFHV